IHVELLLAGPVGAHRYHQRAGRYVFRPHERVAGRRTGDHDVGGARGLRDAGGDHAADVGGGTRRPVGVPAPHADLADVGPNAASTASMHAVIGKAARTSASRNTRTVFIVPGASPAGRLTVNTAA